MSNTETRYFNIADHNIKVVFVDNEKNNMSLLRSYFPFLIPPRKSIVSVSANLTQAMEK